MYIGKMFEISGESDKNKIELINEKKLFPF